jgi:hypothetical protein
MGKTLSWFDTSRQQRMEWEALCPVNDFRVISPRALPTVVPADLLAKADSVLVLASGTACGTVFYMANVHRVDARSQAIDQEPFGFAFVGNSPTVSGCLIHHGRWYDRSATPPQVFWDALAASGIGNCTPFSQLPANAAGHISAVDVTSVTGDVRGRKSGEVRRV